jgi:hypothetical protein
LMTRTIFGDEFTLLNSTSCNSVHCSVTPSLLRPNILLNTLFSNPLSQRSSLNVSGHVSHPYKTASKFGYLDYQSRNAAMVLVPLFTKVTNAPCCGRLHKGATSVCLCEHLQPYCC